ncbi:MAG: fasciclin domain-containing protein [Clostridium sp.]|nr:fasciclin domain-containing protein [Clostridium sp.]
MRNRFSQLSKRSIRALCVLAACGLTYSCSDDYFWDDETPAWLGSSVYNTLQERGNFTNIVKLIDQNEDLKKTLQKTGSRTLFVANDAAFDTFYKENALRPESDPWHTATSFENLTAAQRRVILNSSMINNPYQLEMLPGAPTSGEVVKGQTMRRLTASDVMDSVPYFTPETLPAQTLNPNDEDLWSSVRKNPKTYMVLDNTPTMMIHFINNQMAQNNITDDDFFRLTGKQRTSNDVHIYDSKIIEQNITCENGYINVVDRVILPPSNMAEIIRTNGQTNIFSHILDRFSAPYENTKLTEYYQIEHPEFTGKIYEKRYASNNSHAATTGEGYVVSQSGKTVKKKPDNTDFGPDALLDFDPGWNGYYGADSDPALDMGAVFVPNDETLWNFFQKEGKNLIDVYGTKENTRENLFENIDMIPLNTMNALVNNLLKPSFINSVPSKFSNIKDKSQDDMFIDESGAAYDGKDDLVEAKLANNGAVYIMKKVYMPADYVSVAAPAFISKDKQVIKWAIYNGEQSSAADYMTLKYYAYLRALSSKFTFLIPTDTALMYYYDPVSIGTINSQNGDVNTDISRVLQFAVNGTSVKATPRRFSDDETGVIARNTSGNVLAPAVVGELTNRLKEILESHTIIHENDDEKELGMACGKEYFLAKNGAPIRINPDEFNGDLSQLNSFRGGFQLDNQALYGDLTPEPSEVLNGLYNNTGRTVCNVETEVVNGLEQKGFYEQRNGWSFVINAPLNPTRYSVHDILTKIKADEMKEFYNLCDHPKLDDIVKACGLIDETQSESIQNRELKKYHIFNNPADNDNYDYVTSLFNNYNYTVYIPTNEAIRYAIDVQKLPTWDSINEEIEEYYKTHDEDEPMDAKLQEKLQKQIHCLMNFLKGHFQDRSVFADRPATKASSYTTATLNDWGTFVKLEVSCDGGTTSEQSGLTIKDESGQIAHTTGTINILARDATYSSTTSGAKNVSRNASKSIENILISSTSYAVIHQIDKALQFKSLANNSYESLWEN